MQTVSCPEPGVLREYLQGSLESDRAGDVEAHWEECLHCRDTLADLERAVSLPIPGAGPVEPLGDPLLATLMERVRVLRPADDLPASLGPYLIEDFLGAGGMGRVYRARHRHMDRAVALKILGESISNRPEFQARFRTEMQTAARLLHPHIVTAFDAGDQDGRCWLAMELVDGVDLGTRLRRTGPLPLALVIEFLRQGAEGLAHAHAAGIVHRDVKPGNLLVDANDQLKVADLGLARLLSAGPGKEGDRTIADYMILGTPAYMAPEQADDPGNSGPKADVYGLGCTLFTMLTGRPPYDGVGGREILLAHRNGPIPDPRRLRPDCPPALAALFRRMVDRDPATRCTLQDVLAATGSLKRHMLSHGRKRLPWTLGLAAAGIAAALLAWFLVPPVGTGSGETKGFSPLVPAYPPRSEKKLPAMEMVLIQPGTFVMGTPDSQPGGADERPAHKVRLSRPFLLGKFEVTQELYTAVMGSNPSAFSQQGIQQKQVAGIDTARLPVDSVRWPEAIAFCNKLSELHGLKPYYLVKGGAVGVQGGTGFRLPTEAEWEYACRAGSIAAWCFGDDKEKLPDHAWFDGNSAGRTHPVGSRKPNAWGLHDMHGNVPEWCWDRYDGQYYRNSPSIDPAGGGTSPFRIHRGGGWNTPPPTTRSASRQILGLAYGGPLTPVGLRVARDAE